MASMTLTEKILAKAAGLSAVTAGDEIWATADRMIMNDSSGPRRIAPIVEELGGVWDRERLVIVSDHFVPAASLRHAEILKTTRDWSKSQRVPGFYEYAGILHNIVLEEGLVRPGMLLVGADSHTVSAGAVGAVAVAVGSTELATVIATGQVWLRVPSTRRVDLEGRLAPLVDMRDITMAILRDHGLTFASYQAIEYGGSFASSLTVNQRLVLCNQGIEMGAKNALVVPSQALFDELRTAGYAAPSSPLLPDEQATYASRHTYDVSRLAPQVTMHGRPDQVQAIADVESQPVDMAWLGSCVGGRLEDLQAAARLLKGRKVRVPFLVTPNTRRVYSQALQDGTLASLVDAGATILPSGCGACAGLHSGVQGPSDVVMATATRNFKGRMGSPDAQVFLGSAYSVAAAALTGRITDPREVATGRLL